LRYLDPRTGLLAEKVFRLPLDNSDLDFRKVLLLPEIIIPIDLYDHFG